MQTKVVIGSRGKFVLRWRDPQKSSWRERSTNLEAIERNRGKAHQLLAQLQQELSGQAPPSLTISPTRSAIIDAGTGQTSSMDGEWEDYEAYFIKNHLAALSDGYRSVLLAVVRKFHSFANPRYLQDITPQMVRRWITNLQETEKATATIHSYWGCLSAFLRIAVDDGIIKTIPKIRLPKIDRQSMSKGRSITGEEFERMLAAAETAAPKQAQHWKFVLQGLWTAGLRIGEAYRLTWDDSDFCVELDREYPCFLIKSAGQKSRRQQTLPLPPEFAKILREVPGKLRKGRVFRFLSERGNPIGQAQAERVIAKFGREAKIKVSKSKTATAHDLRRSFGSRWALKVMPQVLQQLMRHADIQTTMRFYVDLKANDLGKVLYEADQEANQNAEQPAKPSRNRVKK